MTDGEPGISQSCSHQALPREARACYSMGAQWGHGVGRIILVESSGNQAFIFATNRLRENVGGSVLVRRVGDLAGTAASAPGIQPVVTTSGKAIAIADDPDAAASFIEAVTSEALTTLPGLEVSGAVGPDIGTAPSDAQTAVAQVHQRALEVRSRLPGPYLRFQTGPFHRPCDTSSLPAEELGKIGTGRDRRYEARSAVVIAKRAAANDWREYLEGLLPPGDRFVRDINELEERLEDDRNWMAVIHADGDRMGRTFLRLLDYLEETGRPVSTAQDYLDAYATFSATLDEVATEAFKGALAAVPSSVDAQGNPHPHLVIPLVLGGDDLTLLSGATVAVTLVGTYLAAFERLTEKRLGKRFTASAGIAFTKPHFPFHTGYALAEELLRSAKTVEGESSVDFHVVFDSTLAAVDSARATLERGGIRLYGGPFRLTDLAPGGRLGARVKHLNRRDEDGVPRSQIHALREGLFLGRREADRRVGYLRARHASAIGPLLEGASSLIAPDGSTSFLDALSLAEFWDGHLPSLAAGGTPP